MMIPMKHLAGTTRRTLLQQAAAAPFFIRNLLSAPPGGKLRLASFGAGGMAYYTLDGIATHPNVSLVCVADVDSKQVERTKKKYPDARVYDNWRRMLDRERKNIDIVCVGTPDHMHAPMAMTALRLGFPAYVQKPLAHSISEVRKLTELARRKGLVTQMGIQVHSNRVYRQAVELIQSGAIGEVKEVHSFSNKKWGDVNPLPSRTDTPPPELNWDQWLGVAEPRPYIEQVYHPVNWRKRLDFGTATFGDMGCHILDPVFSSLRLPAPLTVRSEGAAPNRESWAINSIIHYTFPGGLKLTWYDGEQRPPAEVLARVKSGRVPPQGSIFIGAKGDMLLPHSNTPVIFYPDPDQGYRMPAADTSDHYHQFVDAVLGKAKASTSFDYSGPLTEAVLLGPIATHFPNTTLEWNAQKLRFANSREATALVHGHYRRGWKVKGLS
jgi:predicted dehydrogenase